MDLFNERNMEKIKKASFWAGIGGSVKLMANGVGYQISDADINMAANVLAFIGVIIGVFRDNGKRKTQKTA